MKSLLRLLDINIVGYKYTRTISSKIFNQKSVVKQLDLDNGTKDMECSCSSSEFCYDLLDMWSLEISGL